MEYVGEFMTKNPGYFTFIIVFVVYILACTIENICLAKKQKNGNSYLDNLSRNSTILHGSTKIVPYKKEDESDGKQ
nr:MAG TPA: hypothetical protein [Caudoviricetes sp.]